MKNILKLSLLAVVALSFGSCGKWLDVTSKSEQTIDEMFGTAEGYYSSVTGVYVNMGDSKLYGGAVSLTALEPITGQYTVSANNTTRTAWAAYKYDEKTSQDVVSDIWLTMYNNIVNSNLVIDKLRAETRMLFEAGVRELMLGEMLAMRAYMYFDLVRMFNDPYVLNSKSNNVPYKTSYDSQIGVRLTSEKLLEIAMSELKEALMLLEANDPIVTNKKYKDAYVSYDRTKRMNYYAVTALMARMALYTGDYATAYSSANVVINSKKFSFMKEEDIVQVDKFGSETFVDRVFMPEMVFTLETPDISSNSKSYYDGLSEDFIKSEACYESADIRRGAWLYKNPSAGNKINMIKYKRSALSSDSHKYHKPSVPMLKLGEMYLIAEEALMSGSSLVGERLSFINTLKGSRKAAFVADGASKTVLEAAIMREYICEFKGEGQLFLYYKRLDRKAIDNGFNNGNIITLKAENFVFPRPQSENDYGN